MSLKRTVLSLAAVAALFLFAGAANATTFVVDAYSNSSSGGTGLATIALTAGEAFHVAASPDDLWSAGSLPRTSDADGLTGPRYATGTDETGLPAGTLIGADFGLLTRNGLSAPYASLVGEIGGVFKLLGTDFDGPAWGAGVLNLYFWDVNHADNSGSILVDVTDSAGVPEPATWALLLLGVGAVGGLLRRRRGALATA